MTLIPVGLLSPRVALFIAAYLAALGYLVPMLRVRQQRRQRQKEIQHALADALDLLVVCVEAGLGLNQALVRVSEEIRHLSTIMSQELLYTNAEIRAGTPRDEALRHLGGDRTGVDDIASLVTMLIQTDRFGTSIGRSLRVHSDVLRQKRRQRAEEAAAKTAIENGVPSGVLHFPGHVRGHSRPGSHGDPARAGRPRVMKYLRIVNRTRNRDLGSRVGLADQWWLRARGFMGRPQPAPGEGLLLSPCRAVHMHGMKFPLDVAFLDRAGSCDGHLLRPEAGAPDRVARRARYALEIPAGTLAETGTDEGDLVAWLLVGKYRFDEADAAPVEPAVTATENRRPEGQVDS